MSVRLLVLIAALSFALPRAFAQPVAPAPTDAPKPWAAGVSEDEQKLAIELYEQGNVEFQAARFQQALVKYTEALKHWDHPAIHFNMAVCFINLDQPLEAKQHLERALQYGEEPLGHDMYAQGLTHRHSLDGQIARVKITCLEPGTTITLDGTYLFTAPGEVEKLVLPGKHQVVGMKPGYMTASETLDLAPARLTKHDVHLIAFKAATNIERRWAPWKPVAVLAGGATLAGIGAITYVMAKHNFEDYDDGVAARCPHGCDATMAATVEELIAIRDRGDVEQAVAFTLLGVGGAVAITGAIGVYLNQPHARVMPTITAASDGAMLTFGSSW